MPHPARPQHTFTRPDPSGGQRPAARRCRPLAVLSTLALTAAFAVTFAVAFAAPASAHNQLERSVPAAGTTVPAPAELVLTFNDKVLDVGTANRVVVTGPNGHAKNTVAVLGSTVTAVFATALAPGTYQVEWRIASADGHPVSGRYAFTATAAHGRPPTPSPLGTRPTTTPPTASSAPAASPPAAPSTAAATTPDQDRGGATGTIVTILAVLAALGAGTMLLARRATSRREGTSR